MDLLTQVNQNITTLEHMVVNNTYSKEHMTRMLGKDPNQVLVELYRSQAILHQRYHGR